LSTGTGRGRRRILRVAGIGAVPQQVGNRKVNLEISAYGAPHALLANFVRKLFVATYALLADSYLYFSGERITK
jgi:hypothetical protein